MWRRLRGEWPCSGQHAAERDRVDDQAQRAVEIALLGERHGEPVPGHRQLLVRRQRLAVALSHQLAVVLTGLGSVDVLEGRLGEGRVSLEDGLARARKTEQEGQVAIVLRELALLARAEGELDAARHLLERSAEMLEGLDRGGDLGGGVLDALGQRVDAADDVAVAAGRAARRQRRAVLEDAGEADVVAADAQRDDARAGGQRVELRWVRPRPHAVLLGHVPGGGPAAAHVHELAEAQHPLHLTRVVAVGAQAAERLQALVRDQRSRGERVAQGDVAVGRLRAGRIGRRREDADGDDQADQQPDDAPGRGRWCVARCHGIPSRSSRSRRDGRRCPGSGYVV